MPTDRDKTDPDAPNDNKADDDQPKGVSLDSLRLPPETEEEKAERRRRLEMIGKGLHVETSSKACER